MNIGTMTCYDTMRWSINRWSRGYTAEYWFFIFYTPIVNRLWLWVRVESLSCLPEASLLPAFYPYGHL
jgi:hypothetical protein